MFRGGPKETAKMMALMTSEERNRIWGELEKKDPKLVAVLKSLLVSLQDILRLSPNQWVLFLRMIEIEDLGLALRVHPAEFQKNVLAKLPTGLQKDVALILNGPPRPKSKVLEAEQKIVTLLLEKVEKGELVLTRDDDQMV